MRALTVVLVAFLAGCGGGKNVNPNGELAARLAVTYAVQKHCEHNADPVATCARVAAIAADSKRLLSGESVTLVQLKEAVYARLPDSLSPADRTLAIGLLEILEAEIQARVNIPNPVERLDPEQIVVVNKTLDWVINATKLYG